MTVIYLHIGMPKTGTTYLQNLLFENREKLLDKSLLYPLSGRTVKFTLGQNQYRHHISMLISNLPDFLINNELLSTQERIALLKEFEESNRKVAQEYLGREDGKLFDSTPEQIT